MALSGEMTSKVVGVALSGDGVTFRLLSGERSCGDLLRRGEISMSSPDGEDEAMAEGVVGMGMNQNDGWSQFGRTLNRDGKNEVKTDIRQQKGKAPTCSPSRGHNSDAAKASESATPFGYRFPILMQCILKI